MLEGALQALDHGDDGLAPEGGVGLHIIGSRIVARQAKHERRHAEAERDFARSRSLGLDEVHVLGRKRQRLPVETAVEQQRAAGVVRAREILLELALQAIELRIGKLRAIARAVDERARGARGIVEKRLVPEARGIVRVDRDMGRG